MDDQRPVVLSTLRPQQSLVLSSHDGNRQSADGEGQVPGRSMSQRWEQRPPPPYPHRHSDLQRYPALAMSSLSQREQLQSSHSTTRTATCEYRKENSTGLRTSCDQPIRANDHASAVVQPSSSCTDRSWPPCSDSSLVGGSVNDATLLSKRMSPPALPLRTNVRTSFDRRPIDNLHQSVGQMQLMHQITGDVVQPQPRTVHSYHSNRFSNLQPSTSTLVRQQLIHHLSPTKNTEQRHVTMTSSSSHDVVSQLQVDGRPLDQLQQIVDGPRVIMPGQQGRSGLDSGDALPRHLSPLNRLMTSGHLTDRRSNGPTIIIDQAQQNTAPAPLVRSNGYLAITEAGYTHHQQGAGPSSYHANAGYSPRFSPGASTQSRPVMFARESNLCHVVRQRSVRHSAVAAPLDMSPATQRRFQTLNQVITVRV